MFNLKFNKLNIINLVLANFRKRDNESVIYIIGEGHDSQEFEASDEFGIEKLVSRSNWRKAYLRCRCFIKGSIRYSDHWNVTAQSRD